MSGLGSQQDNAQANTTPAVSNEKPGSKVIVEQPVITINVFFDGTGNNMYNTEASSRVSQKLVKQTSYKNYYSNVALLYMACTETATVKKIYIEGAGTFALKGDSSIPGLATAQGKSGVHTRVCEAFKLIQEIVEELNPISIILNVYGFSRGAFYARYFCAMAKLRLTKLTTGQLVRFIVWGSIPEDHVAFSESGRDKLQYDSDNISINFVGIYDTVSSHGARHYNDVKPFRLNIGRQQGIRKIVHLTAENDYRTHFPLTRVNTAAGQGVAFECRLPGAHSDIGGAYIKTWEESQYLSVFNVRSRRGEVSFQQNGEITWRWFKERGYYKGDPEQTVRDYDQFKVTKVDLGRGPINHYSVYANRKFVSNSYQFIPLEIMKTISEREAGLTFTSGGGQRILNQDITSVTTEGGVLKKFRDHAYRYVMMFYQRNGLDYRVLVDSVLTVSERQELYNRYIHNSLDVLSIENDGNNDNGGPERPERIIINDS